MLNIVQYTGAGYLWLSAKKIKKPVRSKQACTMIVKYNYKLGFVTATHISNKKLSCSNKQENK